MGSGRFLVRPVASWGTKLVKAWHMHDSVLVIPPDEDEVLHARRLVAQQCLYGVDKNPMAVDLAKLSLCWPRWPGTTRLHFSTNSRRCGDSLVGLTKRADRRVSLDPPPQH